MQSVKVRDVPLKMVVHAVGDQGVGRQGVGRPIKNGGSSRETSN